MALLTPGSTLGPYQIVQQIGLGGMAMVYKAFQPAMHRYVALKVLPDHFAANPEFVARFIREARTIAGLEHRSILPVYDFGEENHITYLAMRYLEGGTLKEVAQKTRLGLPDVVDVMTQVAAALDYAHRRGVIHRDVKPANILIDGEGAAYLTDFGIAKVLEAAEGLTATGATIGTPAYMAPEQSLGQKVDHRTDIYALGIILYEMVIGHPPYQADTPMAVALAHIHHPLPIPSAVNPNIPIEIEEVLLKALAKAPDDRYQSAKEMADNLRKAAQQAGVDLSQRTLAQVVAPDPTERLLPEKTSQKTTVTPPIPAETLPETAPVGQPAPAPMPSPVAPPSSSPKKQGRLPCAVIGIGGLGLMLVVAVVVAGIAFLPGLLAALQNGSSSNADNDFELYLYDDFDNEAFDNGVDFNRWNFYTDSPFCRIYQLYGDLYLTNDRNTQSVGCEIVMTNPETMLGSELTSMAAHFYIEPEGNSGWFGTFLRYIAYFDDGEFAVECGFTGNYPEVELIFSVYDTRITDDAEHLYFIAEVVDLDSHHELELMVDPNTMTFSCTDYGDMIGHYTPANFRELQPHPFERQLSNWRDPNAKATFRLDFLLAYPP